MNIRKLLCFPSGTVGKWGGAVIIIVEDREGVGIAIASAFDREGIAAACLRFSQFIEWIETVSDDDIGAVEAFLLAESDERIAMPRRIRARSQAPILALNEQKALSETLALFSRGFDLIGRHKLGHGRPNFREKINGAAALPSERGQPAVEFGD